VTAGFCEIGIGTSGDAGLFWDLTDKSGNGFTVIVENCILAGYRVLTAGPESSVAHDSIKGKVQAYLQCKQPMPKGFERPGLWPTELFAQMATPRSPEDLKTKAAGTK
jgi:hypothetical protein